MAFSYVAMMTELGMADFAALPDFSPSDRAPIGTPLGEATVGLFVTCGAILPHQRQFASTNDLSFRLIPREVPVAEVNFSHPTPVRGFAEQDLNVAYPRDRLVELQASGSLAHSRRTPSRCSVPSRPTPRCSSRQPRWWHRRLPRWART
jgi:hypothetical protein